jgi:hypothetical protein
MDISETVPFWGIFGAPKLFSILYSPKCVPFVPKKHGPPCPKSFSRNPLYQFGKVTFIVLRPVFIYFLVFWWLILELIFEHSNYCLLLDTNNKKVGRPGDNGLEDTHPRLQPNFFRSQQQVMVYDTTIEPARNEIEFMLGNCQKSIDDGDNAWAFMLRELTYALIVMAFDKLFKSC